MRRGHVCSLPLPGYRQTMRAWGVGIVMGCSSVASADPNSGARPSDGEECERNGYGEPAVLISDELLGIRLGLGARYRCHAYDFRIGGTASAEGINDVPGRRINNVGAGVEAEVGFPLFRRVTIGVRASAEALVSSSADDVMTSLRTMSMESFGVRVRIRDLVMIGVDGYCFPSPPAVDGPAHEFDVMAVVGVALLF
jgi:hypothetical protein